MKKAWKSCGFATKARALLKERGFPFDSITLDKISPLHAELAFSTGRATVPYIFVNGDIIGGFDGDENGIGLVNALDSLT